MWRARFTPVICLVKIKMNISHIVIVRFSIRTSDSRHLQAYGSEEKREQWFAMRSRLFAETLYASLQQQSVPPLKVFLLMDEADEWLYAKYLNINDPRYMPIFSKGTACFGAVSDWIKNSKLSNLALSRIDSDDLIARNFLEEVGLSIESATSQGKFFKYVVSAMGWKTDGVRFRKLFFNYSPFLTLFCQKYSGENVYAIRHGQVYKQPHIVCHNSQWMQFIHGGNLSNGFPGEAWWQWFSMKYLTLSAFNLRVFLAAKIRLRQKFYSHIQPIGPEESRFWPNGFVVADLKRFINPL